MMLDFHQQDGRFKVSDQPDMSNTLTSHMGTGGNNVPLIRQVDEIERERVDAAQNGMPGGHSGECRPRIRPLADVDGSRGTGCAVHLSSTSNGEDVFPPLCATDGIKQFIDNQSINGGRLLIDRRN